jgi:hypothetical protein
MKIKSLFTSIIMFGLLFSSCGGGNMQRFETEIIQGKVSAKERGIAGYRYSTQLKIWIQSAKETKLVTLPNEYNDRWNVGDSVILIIEKYKVYSSEKNK